MLKVSQRNTAILAGISVVELVVIIILGAKLIFKWKDNCMKLNEMLTSMAVGSPQIPVRIFKKVIRRKKPKKIITEALQTVSFGYSNYKNDPNPTVKVLDFEYPGQTWQKSYGKRSDVLGWNLNYFINKEYAEKAIDDIDSFARLLSGNNKLEKYERIKKLFPEQAAFIRRYNKVFIDKDLDYKDLVQKDDDAF